MDKQRARLLIDCNRMAYICDPQECGHEYDENNGWCKNCQEHYEALVIAVECIDKCIEQEESPCTNCQEFSCSGCLYSGRLE